MDVKKIESDIWNLFRRRLLYLCRDLQSYEDVAAIVLTMKLIFDGMKASVLSRMMLSIIFESLVAGFERLLGKGAEREGGETD